MRKKEIKRDVNVQNEQSERVNVENRKNVTKEKQIECKRQNIRQAKNKMIFSQRKQTKPRRKKILQENGRKKREKKTEASKRTC